MPNIIADAAGQYKSLVKLAKLMPDEEFISLGDMVDRGPDSDRVIEFFRKKGNRAVLGNHEHMMLDWCRKGGYYDPYCWLINGGDATLRSYDPFEKHLGEKVVPEDVLDWIQSLPLYLEIDGCLLSHAFIRADHSLSESTNFGKNIFEVNETRIIWNRREPTRRPEWKMQIAGHNSQFGLRRWADEKGEFAICLDDSRKRMLTGLHLPSFEVFQVPYER